MAKITYTAATLADEVGTDAKTLRKFLRDDTSGIASVGKGGRYSIDLTAPQLAALKKKYAKFQEAAEARKAARAEEMAAKATNVLTIAKPAEATETDIVDIEDDEAEPTEKDIEDIEAEDDIEV